MTREEFAEKWQQQHYPTMDLQAEVPFYYDIYQRICSVAKEGCKEFNEFYVIQILLYVENMGHLKLDGVYAQLYRQSEDMVGHWCGLMELSAPTVNAVKMIVGEAIGKAPESGLVKWVQESVASHDFNELKSVALFFAQADLAVGLLFPNSYYRHEVYLQLFNEDSRIASNMVSRKQPNYKYKPTGKSPSQYFTRKINEVFKWTVEDSTDLNYGLRVLEGWMKQAHVYLEAGNYSYAHFIASSIVFSGANYSDWYIADYPKQAARMKKIVRDGFEVVMETLTHDPSNWRDAFAKTLKQLKSYDWEIFKGKGAFDLNKAIKDVENLLKK